MSSFLVPACGHPMNVMKYERKNERMKERDKEQRAKSKKVLIVPSCRSNFILFHSFRPFSFSI